ncbi:MAG: folate family ECF transporter S component [Christensenellales bacterium]
MKNNTFSLRTLIIMALFAALGVALKAFFSLQIAPAGLKTAEVSLTPIPVMLSGIFFGPVAGFLVGLVTDIGGFFIGAQMGAYNPLFSISMGLFGVIAGLFYLKSQKNTTWKATAAVAAAQITVSVVINTIIIWLSFGVPLPGLLATRLVGAAVELPVYVWLIMLLTESLRPLVKQVVEKRNASAA